MKLNRKLAAAGVAAAMIVGGSAAYAFFTSTGTGTGSATVGNATSWTVNGISTSGGPLFPGSGTETINYTVTNASAGHQALNAVAVVIDTDGSGNVLDANAANAAVVGCKAVDFVVTDTPVPGAPLDLAGTAPGPAGSRTSTSSLTLTNTAVSQDACQGVAPAYHVNAS